MIARSYVLPPKKACLRGFMTRSDTNQISYIFEISDLKTKDISLSTALQKASFLTTQLMCQGLFNNIAIYAKTLLLKDVLKERRQ